MTSPDWSKIGRRSRRKGKKFECHMARLFREWFGGQWETTRNSGRTDLPGDIYCVDRDIRICIECKHRLTWGIGQILRPTREYVLSIEEVRANWWPERVKYPVLWVWRKDEHGIWLCQEYNGDPCAMERDLADIFDVTGLFAGSDGRLWHRVEGRKHAPGNFDDERFIFRQAA